MHIGQDIRRFGLAICFSTEVFKCFNAIFCLCSIYSNHQAASRDTAQKFASLDRLKHILSGGYWHGEAGEWVRAGPSVLRILKEAPIIQRHLGWVSHSEPVPGETKSEVSPSLTLTFSTLSQDMCVPWESEKIHPASGKQRWHPDFLKTLIQMSRNPGAVVLP